MTQDMEVFLDGDEMSRSPITVVDATNTILLWTYEHVPTFLRSHIKIADDLDTGKIYVALVPAHYAAKIDHITRDPYFAPNVLDVYVLADGSALYVGA